MASGVLESAEIENLRKRTGFVSGSLPRITCLFNRFAFL